MLQCIDGENYKCPVKAMIKGKNGYRFGLHLNHQPSFAANFKGQNFINYDPEDRLEEEKEVTVAQELNQSLPDFKVDWEELNKAFQMMSVSDYKKVIEMQKQLP